MYSGPSPPRLLYIVCHSVNVEIGIVDTARAALGLPPLHDVTLPLVPPLVPTPPSTPRLVHTTTRWALSQPDGPYHNHGLSRDGLYHNQNFLVSTIPNEKFLDDQIDIANPIACTLGFLKISGCVRAHQLFAHANCLYFRPI